MAGTAPLTATGARERIRAGAYFGDVAPLLSDLADRAELAEWFVREPRLPNRVARGERSVVRAAPVSVPTGDACTRCGGMLVRTGTCLTCQSCADSSGGCG